MALTAGTRLGPYEITAQIGQGGMGEVYLDVPSTGMDAASQITTRRILMRSLVLALALACSIAADLTAQTAGTFAGTYDLVRVESLNDSGEWVTSADLFGPDPLGIIMYDGVGSMSVHIVRRDREAEDAVAGIVNGYMAYYGRYEVDAARRVVTHRREGHINPDQADQEAERGFEFDGDLLILTVEPARQLRLFWRKRP